jgi:hypothetical protein
MHTVLLALPLLAASLIACDSSVEFAGTPVKKADPPPTSADATPPDTPPTIIEPTTPAAPSVVVLEESFPASDTQTTSIAFDPEYRFATQTVTLAEQPPAMLRLRQIERAAGDMSFQQGHDGQRAAPESFSISQSGKLDLLVVVDDSTSMSTEQTRLASQLQPLLSKIGNTDWQIAVVSTSSPCIQAPGLIKKGDPNAATKFSDAVIIPLDDTVIEKGFPMAVKALKGECNNVTNPWIRPGSAIGVLILSDEDNCGSHEFEGCPGEQGETAQQMVEYLRSIRPAEMGKIYGLIRSGNICTTTAFDAPKYKVGIDLTGGTWGSICAADYSPTLQAISDNVSRIVKREFTLVNAPDAGTLQVTVDGVEVTSGFTINGKTLSLTVVDPMQENLVVNYIYGATPKYSRFTLPADPDPSTLAVTVNGAAAAATDYSFDTATREIIFVDEPVDDAMIRVRYRADQPLPTEFMLGTSDVLGDPIEVAVAGSPTQDYVFDPAAAKVTLTSPPMDGAEVAVTYRKASGRIVRYPVVVDDAAEGQNVEAKDKLTGDDLIVTIDGRQLVFGAADVVAGREVDVTYELGYDPAELSFGLGETPLPDTLDVSAENGACGDGLSVVGQTVSFACDPMDVGKVTIKFSYVAARYDTFTVSGDLPAGELSWQVFVDGDEVTEFERLGRSIKLPLGLLARDSVVTVKVSTKN